MHILVVIGLGGGDGRAVVETAASSDVSLQVQQPLKIAEAIMRGIFPEDKRPPSSRLLSKHLHVSRNTVVLAYVCLATTVVCWRRTAVAFLLMKIRLWSLLTLTKGFYILAKVLRDHERVMGVEDLG